MHDDFYAKAHELTRRGEPFATAVVVRALAPSSGKPGDKAIITLDGVLHGWIGGSCAQPTVVREALQALAEDECRLIRLSTGSDEPLPAGVTPLPMTCYSGGTLELFIEPRHPRPRLLIVGAMPVARALAKLGRAMDYQVIGVDPDGSGALDEEAEVVIHDLTTLADEVTPHTYVVVATHGTHDEPALEQVLRGRPAYAGLVASPARAAALRQTLAERGLEPGDLGLLKSPAGLDIHARRGDEIALSIMAEIVERRRTSEQYDLAALQSRHPPTPATEAPTAIDPICGMSVQTGSAAHTSAFAGERYYFCCGGCKTAFDREPEAFAT